MSENNGIRSYVVRFSLSSLLMVTTIIAIALAFAIREFQHQNATQRLESQIDLLTSENRRLRNEVGELTIEDPTKLHLVRAPTTEVLTWKWRLWIPEGKFFTVRAVGGGVPSTGFPDAMGIPLTGGAERWCEYRLCRNPSTEAWQQTLQVSETGPDDLAGSPSGSFLTWPIEEAWWLDTPEETVIESTNGIGESMRATDAEKPIVLLQYRVSRTEPIPDPTAGVMVWLEPKP